MLVTSETFPQRSHYCVYLLNQEGITDHSTATVLNVPVAHASFVPPGFAMCHQRARQTQKAAVLSHTRGWSISLEMHQKNHHLVNSSQWNVKL